MTPEIHVMLSERGCLALLELQLQKQSAHLYSYKEIYTVKPLQSGASSSFWPVIKLLTEYILADMTVIALLLLFSS